MEWVFSMEHCHECKSNYLQAYMKSNGHSGSGQWYMCKLQGPVTFKDKSERQLLTQIADSNPLFYGGVYWGHSGKWVEKDPMAPAYYNMIRYANYGSSRAIEPNS